MRFFFCVGALSCGIIPNVLSSSAIILLRKIEQIALLQCSLCHVASLPCGSVVWSVVCDCGIS